MRPNLSNFDFRDSIQKKAIKISLRNKIYHYHIVPIALAVLSILFCISTVDLYRVNPYYANYLFIASLFFMGISIRLFINQSKALKFQVLDIQCSPTQFYDTLARSSVDMEWIIDIHDDNYVQAYGKKGGRDWSFSELIIIINNPNEGKVYINSIPNPNEINSVSWLYDRHYKVNVKSFIANLEKETGIDLSCRSTHIPVEKKVQEAI